MRLNNLLPLLLAAAAGATAPLAAANAEQLQSAELEARVGDGQFEFRSRMHLWKFTADGKVQGESNLYRGNALGALGEQWGMKSTGTWRRDGDRLCIKWEHHQGTEHCYTVARGKGRMVMLMGPPVHMYDMMSDIMEGTLESTGSPGYAATPVRPSKPELSERPNDRYQRIPGAR